MKQFILATAFATSTASPLVRNTLYLIKDSTDKYLQLIWGKGANAVPSNIILDKENLSYEKTTYTAGVAGVFSFTIPTPADNTDYVVNIYKLGAVFNERNEFTTSVHKTSSASTAALLGPELAKQINLTQDQSGVVATASGATVTITIKDPRKPVKVEAFYETHTAANGYVKTAISVTNSTANVLPVADTAWVKDLAHQCIGDRGVGYTEVGGSDLFTPIDSEITAAGYNIYTITSYAPRYDHRKDEPLYHKVHIAVPSTTSASTLEAALTSIIEDKLATVEAKIPEDNG